MRAWLFAVLILAIGSLTAAGMVACGGDDDDDEEETADDDDDGGDDDGGADDDDDDLADDDLADDDLDDDATDDDAADDDTSEGCDPVGDEAVTICDPVYTEEVEYELSVNGWPVSVNVNYEGEIPADTDLWLDCRPQESWPNTMPLDALAGDDIGIIPWSLVFAYHQIPPGFTGQADVNANCDLVIVDAADQPVSNTLVLTILVKAGGPT